jgi:hypothetical protein
MSLPEFLRMNDKDRIGFGKYNGTPLEEIPASYYHYLWHNGMWKQCDSDPIADYIARNFNVLERENINLIWEYKP